MSANATNTGSVSSSAASQSLNGIIRPQLNSLIISHTFLSLLIPLIISLFYFSTPQSRRRPLFVLNLVAVLLAFVVAVLIDALTIHTILEPLNPWPLAFNIIIGFIGVWQSILVDLTLLVRLISVYPPSHVGPLRFALLIAIPVLLKLIRAINLIVFTKVMFDAMNGPNAAVTMPTVFATTPCLKIEWAAQMIDNTYASLAFLRKMCDQENKQIMKRSSRATLAQHMHTLTRIALTNFVVPTLFSIVQFICVSHNVNAMILNQLVLVNLMLTTFGVAFATVWVGSISRQEAQILDSKCNNPRNRLMAVFGLRTGHVANRSSTATIASSGYTAQSPDEKPSK